MREYEVILHVTTPDDVEPESYLGLRFLSLAGVTFTRESVTELESDAVYDFADGVLGCPCCTSHNTRKIRDTEPRWQCQDDDVEFETSEGLR